MTDASFIRKRQEGLLGSILIKLKFATKAQVQECIEEQNRLRAAGKAALLGEIMKSRGYLTEDHLQIALRAQKKIWSEREQCALAHIGMGDALRQSGKPDDAIDEYQNAITGYPEQISLCQQAWNKIGQTYNIMGKPREAMQAFKNVLKTS